MASKPVDLKLTKADEKKREAAIMGRTPDDAPKYPFSTRFSLGGSELEKLGIDDLPKVGADIRLDGIAKVVSTHQGAGGDGDDDDRSVELQITHLSVEAAKKSAKAEMYPSSSDAQNDNEDKGE